MFAYMVSFCITYAVFLSRIRSLHQISIRTFAESSVAHLLFHATLYVMFAGPVSVMTGFSALKMLLDVVCFGICYIQSVVLGITYGNAERFASVTYKGCIVGRIVFRYSDGCRCAST